jgi:hypothetical protein
VREILDAHKVCIIIIAMFGEPNVFFIRIAFAREIRDAHR